MGQGGLVDVGLVHDGVLPGVVDDGQITGVRSEVTPPADEFVNNGGELGDVGLVSRVGVGHQRDPPVG